MSLRNRMAELLRRVSNSTALTSGAEWEKFREELLFEIDVLEKRVAALDDPVPRAALVRETLGLPGKKR